MSRDYKFQTPILEKIIENAEQSSDPDEIDFVKDLINSFYNYANTVLTFEDTIMQYKENSDGADFRQQVAALDRNRRTEHNVALTSIDIINRLAEQQNLEPFCDLNTKNGTKDVNRTDLGTEILHWTNDMFDMVSHQDLEKFGLEEPTTKSDSQIDITQYSQKRQLSETEQIVKDYNNLTKANRYPIIEKDGHYQFKHYLTQETIPIETVKQNMKEIIENENISLDQKHIKLDVLNKATQIVDQPEPQKTQTKTHELDR